MNVQEILSLEVDVPAGHIERAVTEDALEPENVTPIPHVAQRKCMAEDMIPPFDA